MHTPFTLWMIFLHVQMICIADLHDCVNSHTNNFICLVCFCMFFDMFHILLSVDSLRDPWNVCVCVCVCIYICVCVCVCVFVCRNMYEFDTCHGLYFTRCICG
jgi:hypothetical protein